MTLNVLIFTANTLPHSSKTILAFLDTSVNYLMFILYNFDTTI